MRIHHTWSPCEWDVTIEAIKIWTAALPYLWFGCSQDCYQCLSVQEINQHFHTNLIQEWDKGEIIYSFCIYSVSTTITLCIVVTLYSPYVCFLGFLCGSRKQTGRANSHRESKWTHFWYGADEWLEWWVTFFSPPPDHEDMH